MDKPFWIKRWENGEIGFHLPVSNPLLEKHFSHCSLTSDTQIIVPLCGKSLDLLWLAQLGNHTIHGIEICQIAVNDFFSENKLKFDSKNEANFQVHTSSNINISCGDFFQFKLTAAHAPVVIYDRASMVALPLHLRKKYHQKLHDLTKLGDQIFLCTFVYPQERLSGPPFSVSNDEIDEHYSQHFDIQKIYTGDVSPLSPKFIKNGVEQVSENVLLLTRK